MKKVEIQIDDLLYSFYSKVGQQVGRSPEQAMADALFRTAGEASLEALHSANRKKGKHG